MPYDPLEKAVRRVFEAAPYDFEVRLARDYTHEPGLLANVREHILRAHGFIAEISDLKLTCRSYGAKVSAPESETERGERGKEEYLPSPHRRGP